MPSPVNARPSPSRLLSVRVGVPASSAHGRRRAQTLNFLRAFALPHVAEVRLDPYVTAASSRVYLFYRRTPGVQVLALTLQLHATESGGDCASATLSIEVGTSPVSMSAATVLAQSGSFGGVESVFLPARTMRQRDELTAFVDVSSFDPANVMLVRVTYTPNIFGEENGIARVSLAEVPLATIDPTGAPSTEPGVNELEADVRNRIHQGTVGGKTGLLRFFSELDVARSKVRQHQQIATPTGFGWVRNSLTLGPLDWSGGIGTTWDLQLRGRARCRYGSGTTNRVRVCVLYAFSPTYGTTTLSRLRCVATTAGLGGASAVNADAPLVHTSGVLAVATATLDVPCDGTDLRVDFTFAAQTSNTNGVSTTSNPVTVYSIALLEDEA